MVAKGGRLPCFAVARGDGKLGIVRPPGFFQGRPVDVDLHLVGKVAVGLLVGIQIIIFADLRYSIVIIGQVDLHQVFTRNRLKHPRGDGRIAYLLNSVRLHPPAAGDKYLFTRIGPIGHRRAFASGILCAERKRIKILPPTDEYGDGAARLFCLNESHRVARFIKRGIGCGDRAAAARRRVGGHVQADLIRQADRPTYRFMPLHAAFIHRNDPHADKHTRIQRGWRIGFFAGVRDRFPSGLSVLRNLPPEKSRPLRRAAVRPNIGIVRAQ